MTEFIAAGSLDYVAGGPTKGEGTFPTPRQMRSALKDGQGRNYDAKGEL